MRPMRPALSMQVPLCLVVFGFSFPKWNPIHFPFGSANVYLTVQSPFLSAEGSWLSPCGAAGSQHSSLPALIPWKCPAWMEWLLWTSRKERLSLSSTTTTGRYSGPCSTQVMEEGTEVSLPWHLDALAPRFCPAWGHSTTQTSCGWLWHEAPALSPCLHRALGDPPCAQRLWHE